MSLRTVWLVARREIQERAGTRSFQISTVVTILIVVGFLLLPTVIDSDDGPSYTIGVTGDSPDPLGNVVEEMSPEEGTRVEIETYPNRDALEAALVDEDVDVGVVDGVLVLEGPETDPQLLTLTTATVQSLRLEERAGELGLTAPQVEELLTSGAAVERVDPNDDQAERSAVAFIGTLLLFMSIVTYGAWILIGVVEEKTSRVVEVVLGAVHPRDLLAGKVTGIGLLGLGQLVMIAAIGLVGVSLSDQIDLPGISVGLALWIVWWFLLGFAFYATGYAVTGSLVSRQEDAQNASFPLTMVMLVAYFVAVSAAGEGESVLLRILSVVPPFSPIAMPFRQATGVASAPEVAVAIALMLAATFLMLRLGGRIYAGGLLRTGGRMKLREAFRSAEG